MRPALELEEVFRAAKKHLSMQQVQSRKQAAMEHTAPTALLLYSLSVLWFEHSGASYYHAPHRPWFERKSGLSFFDMLRTLREQSLLGQI